MDKTHSSLDAYYKHWNDHFREWCNGAIEETHLPEPWWGWTPYNGRPLHSVVINLNPAKGGKLQEDGCIKCLMKKSGKHSYSEIMPDLSKHLEDTEKWHFQNRYKPLMQSVGISEFPSEPDAGNHLCIELSPKHGDIKYHEEFIRNARDVYDYVLCFAAEASKRIEKPSGGREDVSLKNIVIVRAASSHIKKIKKSLDKSESHKGKILIKEGTDTRNMIFSLNDDRYKDVKFVCVTAYRNDLPATDTLTEILQELNK